MYMKYDEKRFYSAEPPLLIREERCRNGERRIGALVLSVLQLHISISRRGGEEDWRSSNIMVRGGSRLIIA